MRLKPVALLLVILLTGLLVLSAQPTAHGQGFNGRRWPVQTNSSRPQPQPAAPARASRPATRQDQQAEHLYLTGRRFIEQGFYGEGLDALNQSLALRPGHPRALTYKGIALRALREPRLALQHFDAALAAEPDDGVAHGERGLTYIILGEEQKANDDLQQAKRLRPDLSSWFTRQSQWMAANRENLHRPPSATVDQPAPEVPLPTPPATADADASPTADPATGPEPQFDVTDATSLFKPAAFIVLAFLTLLLALRIIFAITRRIIRRAAVPWRSQLPRQPHARHPAPPHPFNPAATLQQPAPGAFPLTPPRASFRRRHRALLLMAGLGLAVMGVFAAPVLVQAFRLDANKLSSPRQRPTVLDFRGNVYTHLGAPDTPVTFDELPEHLVNALRAREDSRFFEHHGVDWIGLGRAVIADVRHMRIKQGASTLTMQLVEKVYRLEQKGLLNRVRSKLVEWTMAHRAEAALARQLGDRRAAKEAIMTVYLNRVEFGGGTVGVGAASLYFFDKPVSKLTLGESCMLVALLRAPTANSPYRNPDNARLARDTIVAQMLRRGYITEEQAKQARFFVVDNPKKPKAGHNGYLVAAITREINALKADKKVPADIWDHESLVIQTTLDLWAQDILDSEIRNVVTAYKGDTPSDPLGGAGLIVDNATGQIRALVSGQDYSKSQYDLALSSRRQLASIAKPFVYATYLQQGGQITETESNAPLTEPEIRALNNWDPKNASSLQPGTHTLSSGLAFSDNLITVRVGLKAGLKSVYKTLYSAGLVSDKTTTGTTWLLGTFESSLANAVSAYTTFPRGGTRATPYLVQTLTIDDKTIYQAKPQSTPLLTAQTTRQIHQALREAITRGTGRNAMRQAGVHSAVAGKTGTSQNAADVWWVGYGKEITLGIRFGRNSNTPLGKSASGSTMAAPPAARTLKKLSERYTLGNEQEP